MSTTIHAYTEPGCTFPAYVNLTENEADTFALTVRSLGNEGRNTGTIYLTRAQLLDLVNDAAEHLDGGVVEHPEQAAKSQAIAADRDYEAQSRRAQVLDMALRTPGMSGHADVLQAAAAYQAHIEGEKTAPAPERTAPGPLFPGYSDMLPHQQRVVDEKCELDARLAKLIPFFDTPIFAGLDEAEKSRLERQEEAMKAYSAILTERIAAFTAAASTPA